MALQSRHDCCVAVLQIRLLLHEADFLHLRVLRSGQHLGHHLVLRIRICIDAQFRLIGRIGLHHFFHLLLQHIDRSRAVVPEHLVAGVDTQLDRRRRFGRLRWRVEHPLRQIHGDRVGHDRRGDDEDDQQHQHHVHQGRDVDVGHRPTASTSTKCHGLLPLHFGCNETDVQHALTLRDLGDLVDRTHLGRAVATQVERRLRGLLCGGGQARLQGFLGNRLVVPVQRPIFLDGQSDRRGTFLRIFLLDQVGLWQLHLDLMGHQRCRNDEDDQQHQHHVHEGRHVDVGHRATAVSTTEGHNGLRLNRCEGVLDDRISERANRWRRSRAGRGRRYRTWRSPSC
ncbi:hypothetical protein XAC2852_10014 [Xanthomonas citri pv. citri]|nr:hypothetical protein XAC2852_10014 [Xanthomonas citri pv. citri]